ncbi:MAG: PAS domain S-box protein [Alphaproteobacteria bacterium]|nr:PAS domain S-box protein [Alphaproteobacteria bacterium]
MPEVAALLQDYQSTSEISRPALILGSSGKRGSGSIFIARLLVHDARAPGRMKNPNLLVQGMSLLALRQAGALEARQSLSLAWADKPDRPALVSDVQGGASSKWSAVQEADIAGNKILIRLKGYPEWQWPRLWILALSAGALATMLYGTFRSGQLIRFEANSLDRALTTTENRLAETERRENAFFENAGTANCETDFKTGKLLRVNDALCELFGYSREELLNMSFLDITHPGDHHLSTTALVDENGHPRPSVQFEKRYCRKDGQFLWGLVNGRLHVSNSGEPLSYLTVIVDISVRKRDEEVKTMLLRELAHRVRNTVQLVASLSRQSARRARSVADYEGKFNKRLTALSAAQDLLFDTGWKSAPVQGIAERTIKPFLPDDNLSGEVSIELPAVELPTQQAQTLAIAIHELASNSSQYGALATGGSVAFTGKVLPTTESGKQQLYIRWEEKVPRRIRRPRKSGFGMTMLESAMPDQFQGTAAFTWKNTGLVYEALLTLDAFG